MAFAFWRVSSTAKDTKCRKKEQIGQEGTGVAFVRIQCLGGLKDGGYYSLNQTEEIKQPPSRDPLGQTRERLAIQFRWDQSHLKSVCSVAWEPGRRHNAPFAGSSLCRVRYAHCSWPAFSFPAMNSRTRDCGLAVAFRRNVLPDPMFPHH